MKPRNQRSSIRGLTLLEVLVVIAIVALLAALVLPMLAGGDRSTLVHCMSNLKQIGIADMMWAADNNTNFPPLVSTNQAGTMEYVAGGRLDLHCQALASYLPSPNLFHCPEDAREPAPNYASLKNANISYFASLDAGLSSTNLFMSGDRNLLINGKVSAPGLAALTATSPAGWSEEMHSKTVGKRKGNIGFPDGHVEATSEARLSALTASLGTATNRLVFP